MTMIAVLVFAAFWLCPAWLVLFAAQHYADGERTPSHRSSCRRCRSRTGGAE